MHAQWSLHRQFIMWCAHQPEVNNKQVVEDPNVSQFNTHCFFFLNVLTRACAEYINFLADSPGAPSFDDPAPILAQAQRRTLTLHGSVTSCTTPGSPSSTFYRRCARK